jgi:glycosyltransferase involved in cell wall biosynthesis
VTSFSVLLPTYQGERYLADSLASVLSQEGAEFELLIADDGSTDGTRAILDALRDPRVRRVDHPGRLGLYGQLNLLAREARATWLKPWCQDDLMMPGALQVAAERLASRDDIACWYCGSDGLDPDGVRHAAPVDHSPTLLPPDDAAWYLLLYSCLAGNVSNLFLRRSAFVASGGFAETISGDFDIMERLSVDAPIGRIPEALTAIRAHPGQWSVQPGSALEFLEANTAIWSRLLVRLTAAGGRTAVLAPRALEEVLGRNSPGIILRELLRGEPSRALRAWRVVRRFGRPHALARHWLRRRFGGAPAVR